MEVKFFPHPADIEFEVYGESVEEVFENAAKVVCDVITPLKGVEPKEEVEISAESEDIESLLYDFLEKILVLHDSENLVFSDVKVFEIKQDGKYSLKGVLRGEKYNPEKHESGTVIKAITYHAMKIGKKKVNDKEVWYAHVVVDI